MAFMSVNHIPYLKEALVGAVCWTFGCFRYEWMALCLWLTSYIAM